MPEIVGIFGSKGGALAAVDELYELGYGAIEIDETDVMYASGALRVNSYQDETGWIE